MIRSGAAKGGAGARIVPRGRARGRFVGQDAVRIKIVMAQLVRLLPEVVLAPRGFTFRENCVTEFVGRTSVVGRTRPILTTLDKAAPLGYSSTASGDLRKVRSYGTTWSGGYADSYVRVRSDAPLTSLWAIFILLLVPMPHRFSMSITQAAFLLRSSRATTAHAKKFRYLRRSQATP